MENTKLVNRLIFILFIFGLTTLVFSFYMYLSFNDHFSPVKLMLSYTLDRPIVYRVFPALVTNAITFLTKLPLSISAILVMYFSLLGFF